MNDTKFSCPSGGRESTAVESSRICDCCRDRDCFENARVFVNEYGNELIARSGNIRVRDAKVSGASIALDPLPFSRGFYAVNIRYFVELDCEACFGGRPQSFGGIAVLDKKVVLYGGESNASVFRSAPGGDGFCAMPEPGTGQRNLPVCVAEVVDPVVLGSKIVEKCDGCHCPCCCNDIPDTLTSGIGGGALVELSDRYLAVSLGIFSVIRILRPAQYLINAAEFAVPDKECVSPVQDDPCAVFQTMPFPVDEFSAGNPPRPPRREGGAGRCGCGN